MVEGKHAAAGPADHVVHSTGHIEGHALSHINLLDVHQGNHAAAAAARPSIHRVAYTSAGAGAGTAAGGTDSKQTSGQVEFHQIAGYHDWYQYGGGSRDNPDNNGGAENNFKPISGKWEGDHQKKVTDAIDRILTDGSITKPAKDVTVVYQDNSDKPDPKQPKPDIVIQQDGTVVVHPQQHRNPDDPIVVEVERKKGEVGPPGADEQKAVDGVVKYLADNYMQKKPDGTLDGQIHDDQGLVSDNVKKAIAPNVQPSDLPGPAQQQTQAINRWHGSGGGSHGGGDGGSLSPQQQGDVIPPRDVPRQADESDRLAAMKDVVAGFAVHNDKDPYHHVENRGDQGFAVGRYGTTSRGMVDFCNWLSGLTPEQIDELIKKGVLPKNIKDFMKEMESDEGKDFLKKLAGGKDAPSKAEIDKFFGKEVQESAGSYAVTKMAHATANSDGTPNIGKLALGMQLGRVPNDADLKNPEYQKLMDAAQKSYPVALQHVLDGTANIDLSDKAKAIAAVAKADQGKELWTKYASATENGNLGCAASVSEALRQAGAVPQGFNELSVYGLDQHLEQMGWKKVDFDHRQPGDVIVAYRTSNPAGSAGGGAHTGIVGDGGATYSNSSSSGEWSYNSPNNWIPPNGGYVQTYVLRPPSSNA